MFMFYMFLYILVLELDNKNIKKLYNKPDNVILYRKVLLYNKKIILNSNK